MKNLTVNCRTVLILKDREEILKKFDSLIFNCASVTIADDLYAKAVENDATFNCARTGIIKAPENPVRVNGVLTLDAASDYTGAFLVADDIIVTPEGADKLDALEGLFALGTLYHPEGIGPALTAKVQAGEMRAYPDGAKVVLGDVWFADRAWEPNALYYIADAAYATDTDVMRAIKAQGTTFRCGTVYLRESAQKELAPMFACDKIVPVPDGYAFVKGGKPLMDLYATYGEKIYLLGNLTIRPRDVDRLALMDSIIVKGSATLPMERLKACKAVVNADRVSVYEGELMSINGMQTIGHDMLAAANAAGTKYTVDVNGFCLIDENVTTEDIKAIVAMKVNGAVSAPQATQTHLNAVAPQINGTMLPSLAELKTMLETMPDALGKLAGGAPPGPIAKLLGVETDDGTSSLVNCDSYVLI